MARWLKVMNEEEQRQIEAEKKIVNLGSPLLSVSLRGDRRATLALTVGRPRWIDAEEMVAELRKMADGIEHALGAVVRPAVTRGEESGS